MLVTKPAMGKVGWRNFGEFIVIHQIRQRFPPNKVSLHMVHRRRSRSGWSGFGRTTFIQGKNKISFLQKASNEQKC